MPETTDAPLQVEVLRCARCGRLDAGPRDICAGCYETALQRETTPGTGALVSWTMIRRPPAAFRQEGAYAVAVVELDAGVKVTGRLEAPDERMRPGTRVIAAATHNGVPVFRAA
jgi:uncharacterized OB-fold protein